MSLTAGTVLKGNLRLMRELGSGAMGTVWVAENLALGSEVAVKVLHQGALSEQARARFAQEARGLAGISSPHVVNIFDYGVTDEGEPFIVMELLRGEDLRQHIEQRGPLPPAETVHIVRQICRALAGAHDKGIVHRDIKPANIFLVDNDGESLVKVLDFGVAKQLGEGDLGMTETGAMMGTPYYMSPEQLLDPRSVDARTDVWAIGAVCYACLTASVPFVGETLGALSVAIHTGDFEAPSRRIAGLPFALDAWMDKALARKPAERFASVREMAEALRVAAGSQAAGPPSRELPSAPQAGPQSVTLDGAVPSSSMPIQSTLAMSAASVRNGELTDASANDDIKANDAAPQSEPASLPHDGEAGKVARTTVAASPAADTVNAAVRDDAVPASTAHGLQVNPALDQSTLSPTTRTGSAGGGLGRTLMIAAGAVLLMGGGVFLGSKLSDRPGDQDVAAPSGEHDFEAGSPTATTSSSTSQPSAEATLQLSGTPAPSSTTSAGPSASGSASHSDPASGPTTTTLSPAGMLTAADVRNAVLSCWLRHEGKNPGAKAAVVEAVLERPHGTSMNSLALRHPQFKQCAKSALIALYERDFEGRFVVKVQLPGDSRGPAFPDASEVASAARSCWASTEGAEPGTPAFVVAGRISYGGINVSTHMPYTAFRTCFMSALRSMNRRGDDVSALTKFSVSLPASAPAN